MEIYGRISTVVVIVLTILFKHYSSRSSEFSALSYLLDASVYPGFVMWTFKNSSLFLVFQPSKRVVIFSTLTDCIKNKPSTIDQFCMLCLEAAIFASEETSLCIYVKMEHAQKEHNQTTFCFTVYMI